VFVLMLENRSFDHMLGHSAITGTDADSGGPTTTDGIQGQSNSFQDQVYQAVPGAALSMPVDPSHEFLNVVVQLGGQGATYPQGGGAYPAVNNSGFVADFSTVKNVHALDEIMKGYAPDHLPVLNALAKEFVVFDRWFSSMPGPTWPNRFFAHAASAGGLDHSPTASQIAAWEVFRGFKFQNATIFDALDRKKKEWRIYSGGAFPSVAGLKGINNFEVRDLDEFAEDLSDPEFSSHYTFIEPDYGDVPSGTFRGGNSQHPLDDVTAGERLIKFVYETIRKSSYWTSSLLIITWDEHGGFYDHVVPPQAVSPGDAPVMRYISDFGFRFDQYGPRVPAVAVSPLIPKNLIDHRVYDHASIPKTIESIFGLRPLTARDRDANSVAALATLATARTDTPMTLPEPLPSTPKFAAAIPTPVDLTRTVDEGNLPGFLGAALQSDLDLSPPVEHDAIRARVAAIKTKAQAKAYMDEVRAKVKFARAGVRKVQRQKKGLI
jgi:phospholipase C